ncbi:MAG TPA: CAP domain-containing protein [Terriglobales bacterium]
MGTEADAERLTHSMRFSHHQTGRTVQTRTPFLLCCLFLVAFSLTPSGHSQERDSSAAEQRVFSLINQERVKQGLAPLQFDERLAVAARKHTQLMVQNGSLFHQFEGEESLQLRLSEEHVRGDRDGENIALDSDIEVAHVMLMQSPPHRANILDSKFNSVGIGILKTDELYYITEDFARLQPNYSEPEADAVAQQAISDYAQSKGVPVPRRKPLPKLRQMACDMALDDKLDGRQASEVPGVTSAVAWNASDLQNLPPNLKRLLAQPLSSGYSLGVCFAPSVAHPGGVYWLVMVIY